MAYLVSEEYAEFIRSLKNTSTNDIAKRSKREPTITRFSPVVLTTGWTKESEPEEEEESESEETTDVTEIWTAKGRRLWWTPKGYKTAEWNSDEITLCAPCSVGQPGYAVGDRVFAVFRGRWEIIAGTGGSGLLIPVNLEYASGDAGTATTQCSFKYYVQHAVNEDWWTADGWGEEEDRIEVCPATFPSRWKRTRGCYERADYGHAHAGTDGDGQPMIALGWINEVYNIEACA